MSVPPETDENVCPTVCWWNRLTAGTIFAMLPTPRAAMLLVCLALTGCASGPSAVAPTATLAPVEAEFNVPPRELVDRIQSVLASAGLGVASSDKGIITTTYQDFPGDFHIARRWQEHTRYRILVIPDWDAPTAKARVQINEETEQRATDNQPWQPAPGMNRRQRSQELMDRLQKSISAQ
jgi:hypothetical protein